MIDKEKLLNDIEHSLNKFVISEMDNRFIEGVLYAKKIIEIQEDINVQISFKL